MGYQDKEQKKLRGIFPAESRVDRKGPANDSRPDPVAEGQYYALSSEEEVSRRFEIILGSGKRYSFSYALLPVSILEDSATLYLKAYELLITITGRNLDPIHTHFTNESIAWIRASLSGKDDESTSTFVRKITLEGKSIEENI